MVNYRLKSKNVIRGTGFLFESNLVRAYEIILIDKVVQSIVNYFVEKLTYRLEVIERPL